MLRRWWLQNLRLLPHANVRSSCRPIHAPRLRNADSIALNFHLQFPRLRVRLSMPVLSLKLREVQPRLKVLSPAIYTCENYARAALSIAVFLTMCRSDAEQQEEQSLREIVGELMHLTLDPSSNQDEDEEEDETESSSVFEKIEGLRMQLESLLGTQSFLQLYELARVCQDGSSGKLESKIDAINSQDSDLIFNSLVQLLNFESEVYCS
jgi:hypothetical protein